MATSQDLVNADLNLATLDGVVTSNAVSVNDRLGQPKLTIAEIQRRSEAAVTAAGFYPVAGSFEAGGTIIERNQVLQRTTAPAAYFSWGGALPKVVPPSSTVAGTGGEGVTAWTNRNDATLGGALAAGTAQFPNGQTSQTVAESVDVSASNSKSIGRSTAVTLIDMHYGPMRGRGLTSTETLSDGKGGYNLSAIAPAGQKNITLTANTSEFFDIPLVVGQLISYLATDGEYYSASINSISGTAPATITLNSNIEADIGTGRNLFAFMSNEAHPIFYGYRAIADYALRKAKVVQEKISNATIAAANGATLTLDSTDSFINCGSSSVLSYNVTMPIAGTDGVSAAFSATKTGAYIARVVVNTKGNPLTLQWANSGLSSSMVVNCNDVSSFDLPISVRGAGEVVTLFISSTVAGAQINILGTVQIFLTIGATPNLETCKHVLLGDSWFAQTGIFERLQERLPLANIVNKGVGGNTALQLLNRFDSDVATEKPDVVWIVVGTNDYFQSVANDLFNFYVNQLIAKCAGIGAHLMIFNASVGSAQIDAGRFNRSRQLANLTNYVRSSAALPAKQKIIFNVQRTTIPNAASEYQIINFGLYVNSFKITSYWLSAGTLTVGNKTSLNNPQNSPVTLTANSYITADVDLSFSGGRFIDLRVANSSGSDIALYGFIEVESP